VRERGRHDPIIATQALALPSDGQGARAPCAS
jgi:hypothetical protein